MQTQGFKGQLLIGAVPVQNEITPMKWAGSKSKFGSIGHSKVKKKSLRCLPKWSMNLSCKPFTPWHQPHAAKILPVCTPAKGLVSSKQSRSTTIRLSRLSDQERNLDLIRGSTEMKLRGCFSLKSLWRLISSLTFPFLHLWLKQIVAMFGVEKNKHRGTVLL